MIEMQDCVELFGKMRGEVMAISFGLRQVNDTDGSLQLRLFELFIYLLIFTRNQQEPRNPHFMKERFKTTVHSRSHSFTLGIAVPARSGRHCSIIGCETDQHCIPRVP